ncbi:MAG TPA: metallophosphoesterase [Thermoanaerobaculia bacterium]|nr:metallophosphoesterase [Thermoanaerobaculia bacterium]
MVRTFILATTITLLHFSDYHSHAVPFYTEEGERGGIARAIRYLASEKRHGALVFNGGDTINKGSPAWSDKYGCEEWPWWNGVVDAMAFGNHDADYGLAAFERCRETVTYPILSANTAGFKRYEVFVVKGIRIGVFAVAGPDFPTLVRLPELSFRDSVSAARVVVQELRERERVHAVVMIGHEHAEADEALARAVPGIDLIFGTHSHLKRDFTRIEGTQTWFISPWQYLAYISRVQMTFADGRLKDVRGALMPVDRRMREDRAIARRVRSMHRKLELDPAYSELFAPVAELREPLGIEALAQRALESMRRVTSADVALSTISSFRGALPAGVLTMEELRRVLPYDNEIIVCTMPAQQWQRVLDFSASRAGTDAEAIVSGTATRAEVRVATTDYLANVAYRDVFLCEKEKSGLKVRSELRKTLTPVH